MKELEFISDVREGKLQKNISELIAKALPTFNGKRVVILIKKLSAKRSDQQNKFYHAYYIQSQIDCFKERWGEIFTKDQVHTWNLNNIWHKEVIDETTGDLYKIPGSSKTKNKIEFEERLEMGRQFFWNKFDWQLPFPEQQLTIE